LLPTIAGKKLRSERLQKKRSLVSKRLKKGIKIRFAAGASKSGLPRVSLTL
jgi:hypothetical protein